MRVKFAMAGIDKGESPFMWERGNSAEEVIDEHDRFYQLPGGGTVWQVFRNW